MAGKVKKSLFARWWFWLIVIIIAIASFGNSGADNTQPDLNAPSQSSINEILPSSIQSAAPTVAAPLGGESVTVSGNLQVHFLDVGQADSILIRQGESTMLIDGGNNADADIVVNYLKKQGIAKLDYMIGTHPHEDHIGGLDAVVKNFDIGTIIMPKAQSNTQTFEDLLLAIQNKGLKITSPVPGTEYKLGDAGFIILAPNSSQYEDLNNYSIVAKVTFGNNSFLLTGDAESISENEMLGKGHDLNADVLKVGHHGSDSSTTDSFLKAVSPKYAVISVGKDNSYGHPAQETLDSLNAAGVKIYRTDESGTIIATSDGKSITFNVKVSEAQPQAPPATTKPTPTPSASTDQNTVYITKTGAKYHSDGCRYLSKSKIPINLSDAINQGYEPCSVCNPPR